MTKFKPPKVWQNSGGVKLSKSASVYETGYDYPIFCFKYLHKDYNVDCCVGSDPKFLKGLVKKMKLLSDLSWTNIKYSDRQGHGSELITRKSLRVKPPSSITEDVEDFMSFYFAGDKGRMIGYKDANIYHIVYIDTSLSVYSHG